MKKEFFSFVALLLIVISKNASIEGNLSAVPNLGFCESKQKNQQYEELYKHEQIWEIHSREGRKLDQKKITVHLIPHSHMDIAWLSGMEGYYQSRAKHILNNVIEELWKDTTKTFSLSVMGFFRRWWNEASASTKTIVKHLVENKQLDFVGGGFCENDDAISYYEDVIENMENGHAFLKKELNVVPTVGWNIDNFGHTIGMNYLFTQMGFHSNFFTRIHYQEHSQRKEKKELEFFWEPPTKTGEPNKLYQFLQYDFYQWYHCPVGFCFESGRCFPQGESIGSHNVERRVGQFVDYFRQAASKYRFDNVFHFFGDDYTYEAAATFFGNLDQIIKYLKDHPELNMQAIYSTPAKYLEYIRKQVVEQNITLPSSTSDFLPIADIPNSYWTGFFTSRVHLKKLAKDANQLSQVAKTFHSLLMINQLLASNDTEYADAIQSLTDAISYINHHDAITGTSPSGVIHDYMSVTSNAVRKMLNVSYSFLFLTVARTSTKKSPKSLLK